MGAKTDIVESHVQDVPATHERAQTHLTLADLMSHGLQGQQRDERKNTKQKQWAAKQQIRSTSFGSD